ncbi:MAG: arylsulfatase, partial [Polyangiaceae bacterium]
PKGKVNIRYEFTADEPGKMGTGGTSRLFINDKQVADGKLEHTVPVLFSSYAGFDIGKDNGMPVVPTGEYADKAPFPFTGTIEKVAFTLGPSK